MTIDDWYTLFEAKYLDALEQDKPALHRLKDALELDSEGRYFFKDLGSWNESKVCYKIAALLEDTVGNRELCRAEQDVGR